ncbi:MAG TPA: hypothetical protein VE084_24145 [Burkholderiaceae bacterium]|nr:hypothetical protein [Burkholderiaceae bacterium]
MKFQRYRVVTWRDAIEAADREDAAHGWTDSPLAKAVVADLLVFWGRKREAALTKSMALRPARLLVPNRLRRLHGEVLTKSEAAAIDRRRLMLGRT